MTLPDIKIGDTVRVRGFHGVACVYQGPQTEPGNYETVCWDCNGLGNTKRGSTCETCDGRGEVYDEEPEPQETGRALVCMVGDDHKHAVEYDDMTPVTREEYCGGCGQIGCEHDGYPRGDA